MQTVSYSDRVSRSDERMLAVTLLALCMLLALTGCGERDAQRAVAATFEDPDTARFQSVQRHDEFVCGEVIAGSTRGYVRFIYEDGLRRVTVAPTTIYRAEDLAGFDLTCRMLGEGGTAFEREACTRAARARSSVESTAAFEQSWKRSCTQ